MCTYRTPTPVNHLVPSSARIYSHGSSTSCCGNLECESLFVNLSYLLRRASVPAVDGCGQVGERRGHGRLPRNAAAVAGNFQQPHLLHPVILLHHLQRMRKIRWDLAVGHALVYCIWLSVRCTHESVPRFLGRRSVLRERAAKGAAKDRLRPKIDPLSLPSLSLSRTSPLHWPSLRTHTPLSLLALSALVARISDTLHFATNGCRRSWKYAVVCVCVLFDLWLSLTRTCLILYQISPSSSKLKYSACNINVLLKLPKYIYNG